jgi:PBSX family phage terminase large subunit
VPKARIELYNVQDDFVNCRDRFTAMIGGIGSGKSYAGSVKAFIRASERKTLGMITAPTYPMLRDATLRTFMDITDGFVRTFHKAEMTAVMVNGSEILFRSADNPDRLRGPNLNWWFGDEAALYSKDVWPVMIGRLRADGRAGDAWLATTPKGRNWLYERQREITTFKARTRANPYLDTEFIRSLEASYSGKFAQQELEGEFVTYEGLVYEDFDRGRHVKDSTAELRRYIVGADEGYTNPAVLLVVGVDGDGRAHIAEEYYRRRVLQGDVVAEAKRLHTKYMVEDLIIDPSAAGLIAEMQSEGLPVRRANNEVFEGIQAVKARLAPAGDGLPRLTVSPSCVNIIAEFESYVWKETKALGVKDQPEKANDHALDALRYAIMQLDYAPVVSTLSNPWN